MSKPLNIWCGQFNPKMGDIAANLDAIKSIYFEGVKQKADVVILPELAICGYPPEDLLLKKMFITSCVEAIKELAKETEHPRTYEVAGQLIKTVGETAEKLLQLQKQIREIEKNDNPQESPGTVNNNLFVGSTAELQKFLKDKMKDG